MAAVATAATRKRRGTNDNDDDEDTTTTRATFIGVVRGPHKKGKAKASTLPPPSSDHNDGGEVKDDHDTRDLNDAQWTALLLQGDGLPVCTVCQAAIATHRDAHCCIDCAHYVHVACTVRCPSDRLPTCRPCFFHHHHLQKCHTCRYWFCHIGRADRCSSCVATATATANDEDEDEDDDDDDGGVVYPRTVIDLTDTDGHAPCSHAANHSL